MNRRQFMKTSFIFTSGIFVPKLGILRPNPVFARQSFSQRYDVSSEGLAFWLTMDDAASYGTTQDWFNLQGIEPKNLSQTTAGNQLSILNAPLARGKARFNNGTTGYLEAIGSYFSHNQGTVIAWIYPNSRAAYLSIINVTEFATSNNYFSFVLEDVTGKLQVRTNIAAANFDVLESTNAVDLNQWSMVAAASDGTKTKLYINGDEETVVVSVGDNEGTWFGDILNKTRLTVGALQISSAAASFFSGYTQSITVFSRTLTAAEIKRIYDKDRNNFNK